MLVEPILPESRAKHLDDSQACKSTGEHAGPQPNLASRIRTLTGMFSWNTGSLWSRGMCVEAMVLVCDSFRGFDVMSSRPNFWPREVGYALSGSNSLAREMQVSALCKEHCGPTMR